LKSEMFVILNVANLIPYKGHKDLLESFALVKKEIPHAVLLIAGGDRGIGSMLRNKARDLEVDDSVRWLGLRDDVPQLLSLADVFVCSSHEEGFSNAVMEAMAAGVAVVATDVGGNREMLENGRLGVLVPARSPEAMAQAIVRLARDPRLREDLGRNAAATVQEKYTPEAMTDAYLRLYRSLL
ncbi:MAG: glycosyltransferase, partial [Zetaproteobacteria bacterium]